MRHLGLVLRQFFLGTLILGFAHATLSNGKAKSNQFWWPDQLDLSSLRDHDQRSNPLGPEFDYALAFTNLDLSEVKSDIDNILTDSQDWWPADWGNYGPNFYQNDVA